MKKILFLFILLIGSGFIAKTAPAFEAGDIEIHGFISQGYLITDNNNYMAKTEDGTFQFNEMGINFSTELADPLHLAVQIFSRDLGNVGNNEVVLGYAFGDYRWQDWLGVRAGKIKIDFGLYNETREMDMLRTCTMLPQSIYPEVWRDSFSNINGVSLYGYVPGGVMGKFSYNFQIGAMEFDQNGGFAKALGPRLHEELDLTAMDSDYSWFSNLQWHTPLTGLKLKGSYYTIESLTAQGNMTLTNEKGEIFDSSISYDFARKDGYAFSLEYLWKNLTISAEYAEDTYDFDINLGGEDSFSPPDGGPPKVTSQGWYVSASYRFTDWFESGLTYSEYYPNKDNKDGDTGNEGMGPDPEGIGPDSNDMSFTSWLKSTTFSTRFDINEYWMMKLEASYNDGFGGINLAENDNSNLEPYWWLFAAKVTFSF